jgi:hypothetical protein
LSIQNRGLATASATDDLKGDMKELVEQKVSGGCFRHQRGTISTRKRICAKLISPRCLNPARRLVELFRNFLHGKPHGLVIRVPEFIPTTQAHWQRNWERSRDGRPRQPKFGKDSVDWLETDYFLIMPGPTSSRFTTLTVTAAHSCGSTY